MVIFVGGVKKNFLQDGELGDVISLVKISWGWCFSCILVGKWKKISISLGSVGEAVVKY